MTFVFRTSSFFVVFVITVKATTFVVGNTTNSNSAADRLAAGRLNDHVERLVDEAVRFRGEAREAAEKSADMAFALHALGDRVIECAGAVCALIERAHAALRCIARSACVNVGIATRTLHNLRSAMPKKEVKHGGYTTAGQCG
ncbi:MAG: hypothetical protein ACYDA7_05175 [Acidithiobacillus sp.]